MIQRLIGTVVTLLLLAGIGQAQSPFASYFDTPSRDDPSPYPLTPEHGLWMVKVVSFSGDYELDDFRVISAKELAIAVAKELNEKHGIDAYTSRLLRPGDPDHQSAEARKEFIRAFYEAYEVMPRIPRPANPTPENWVVLAGNFDSIEKKLFSPAHRLLNRIKKLDLECIPHRVRAQITIQIDPNLTPAERLQMQQHERNGGKLPSPTATAMLVRNPLAERDKTSPIDEKMANTLISLNAGDRLSVWNVNQPFTIEVAQFRGVTVTDSNRYDRRSVDSKIDQKDRLKIAGQNAVTLAQQLRQMGFEAYTFHGLQGSLVCIGGFGFDATGHRPAPKALEAARKLSRVSVGQFPLQPRIMVTPRRPEGFAAN